MGHPQSLQYVSENGSESARSLPGLQSHQNAIVSGTTSPIRPAKVPTAMKNASVSTICQEDCRLSMIGLRCHLSVHIKLMMLVERRSTVVSTRAITRRKQLTTRHLWHRSRHSLD
jgi:hypothetical protein